VNIDDVIEKRRSIRKFKAGKAVTKEQLKKLLKAAMLVPSACNSKPWEFIAVTNPETLNEIAQVHPYAQMCKTAGAAIIVVAVPKTGMPEGYFPQDCGAATENILLKAVSLGLGTCWCGVYPKEERIADLRKLFKIKKNKIPFNVIAVGYPDEDPDPRGAYDESKVTFIE
jgi:nitroreductase